MSKNNKSKKQSHDLLVKVIIIGDSGVGKTNMLTRFCEGMFKQTYVATIGVDFKIKMMTVNEKKMKLQIWDTAGQQRFRNITQTYYKGAAGILLVYSINNQQSFRNIHSWVKQIDNNTTQSVCKILIGAKSDLEGQRQVSKEEGQKIAAKYGMNFFQVSAKSGSNIQQSFLKLSEEIKNKKQSGENLSNLTEKKGISLDKAQINNQNKCKC